MSGYKRATVTISEEEYRRLHQADMKQRFRERKRAIKSERAAPTAALANTLQEMETRQAQVEIALGELDESLDQAQTAARQEMLRHNAAYYEQIMALIQETASESNEVVASVSQHFAEEMQREREQYRQGMQSLVRQLDVHEQREQTKVEAARKWLRQSVVMSDFIQTHFDHERFAPGRLSRILSSLGFAQSNLAQGFFESSLQTSQQAFLQLSDLHAELEQCIAEWQTEYQRAHHSLDQFIDEMELNARVSAFGLEGEELPDQLDVAFWSNGKYNELLDKCRKLLSLLAQDQEQISADELRRTYSSLVPVLTEKIQSIIYEARLNALNSQLRMNIAEQALQALENHGFRLNDAGYANKDMRAAFTAALENPDGSQVTVQVLPTAQAHQDLSNELVVITQHPYLKTEQEARLQWEELSQSLHQFDLQVSRPTIGSAPPVTSSYPVGQVDEPVETLTISKRHHNVR